MSPELSRAADDVDWHSLQIGGYSLMRPTICFMPHCDLVIYENLLKANWSKERLPNILLVANRLADYLDRSLPLLIYRTPWWCRLIVTLHTNWKPELLAFRAWVGEILIWLLLSDKSLSSYVKSLSTAPIKIVADGIQQHGSAVYRCARLRHFHFGNCGCDRQR